MTTFLRTGTRRYKRLGRISKTKQRWRRARGRHSKIREKKKSKARKVEVGYKKAEAERGKINGKRIVFVENLKQAGRIEKGALVVVCKVGRKKRHEIDKIIKEKGGIILNIKK